MTAVPPFRPTIDYTSRDYDALRSDMIRLIKARLPQWSGDTADFGMALIEAFAYSNDIINYYLDRIANEAYLATAVQRESLYSIAKMFNYTPKTAEAATVPLQFINSTKTGITVPRDTRCQANIVTSQGTAIRNFETSKEIYVPPMEGVEPSVVSVYAQEGRTYRNETIGISNGFVRQRYLLPRTSVLARSIIITSQLGDSVLTWTESHDLSVNAPKDQVFYVAPQTDDSIVIEFGDGGTGMIPPLHSVIRATYRVGGGSGGNVPQGTVNTIVEPVIYGISVNNPVAASGGLDTESIDSIRINAARSYRARDRAVTIPDYEAVAENSPYVAKAKAIGNNASSVTLYVVPNDDGSGHPDLTDVAESMVLMYVQERAMAGVTISVFGPSWTEVFIRLQVVNQPTAVQAVVSQEIRSRLRDFYGFLNVDFDGWVSPSDILAVLSGIDGVQYIEVLGVGTDPVIADPDSTGPWPTTTYVLTYPEIQYFDPAAHLFITHVGGIG